MSEAEHLSRAIRGFFSDPQNGWFPPFVESIDGLTAAQVSWIPSEGLRSIWEISNHVRFYHQVILLQLQKEPIDRATLGAVDGWPPAGRPGDEQAWQKAIRQLVSHRSYGISYRAGRADPPPPGKLDRGLAGTPDEALMPTRHGPQMPASAERVAAVIVKDRALALIERRVGKEVYYLFPGGSVEGGRGERGRSCSRGA